MRFDPNQKIHPQKRDELLARPEIKQRIRVMDIISAAFFGATIVYLWILSAGLLSSSTPTGEGFPVWYVLVFLAVSVVPVMTLIGNFFIGRMNPMTSGAAVLGQGQTLLIAELALAETPAVYGLIGGFLGAPKNVQYGLIGFGMLLMAAAVLTLRPKIIDLALARYAEEAKER